MQKVTLIFAMAGVLLIILKPQEIEARMTLAQLKNAMKGVSKTCIGKTGVDPDIVKKSSQGEFLPDPALQCYFLCLYGGLKVVKDGRLSTEMINKQCDMMMPLDIIPRAKEATQKCDASSSSIADDCERIWHFTKCYYEADPANDTSCNECMTRGSLGGSVYGINGDKYTSSLEYDSESTSVPRQLKPTERRKHRGVINVESKVESTKGRCKRKRGVPRCTGVVTRTGGGILSGRQDLP